MGVDGIAEELKGAAILLARGRQHGPDAFATGSLRDVTLDQNVPNGLFRLVLRRLDPRCRQKAKVIVGPLAAKAIRQGLGLPPPWRMQLVEASPTMLRPTARGFWS